MIKAKVGGGQPRELIPSGSHIARCYEMIHIGTVKEMYMGEEKMINKIRISFELPNEMRVFNEEKGEQPMVTSREFTLSMHEKSNLRGLLQNWRGKAFTEQEADDFDVTTLLGVPCMLSVVHVEAKNGNTYANIGGISGVPKGIPVADQINPTVEFNYEEKFNTDFIDQLPSFIKDKIMASLEYKGRMAELSQEETKKKVVELDNEMDTATIGDQDDLPFIITALLGVGSIVSMLV